MLKTGIRFDSIDLVDNIFKTCCKLHNFLLEADGMDLPWEGSLKAYDCCNNEFEDFAATDISDSIHEMFRNHGDLRSINFATVGGANLSLMKISY